MQTRVLRGHLLALVACTAWISCSGGDGDDDGPRFRPPPPLPVDARWQLDSPTGDLTATLERYDDIAVTIGLPLLNLAGSWNTVTDDITIRNGDGGATALRIVAPARLPAEAALSIGEALSLSVTVGRPVAGRFDVSYGASVVRVTCRPTEVDLDLDSGAQTATLTWEAFESVEPGGTAPVYQQVASFTYGVATFLLEQVGRVIEGLDAIRTDEEDLIWAGSGIAIVEYSEPYPPIGRDGMLFFSWFDDGDVASRGEPGPGDDFLAEFQEFWENDPNDDFDELLGGDIRLVDYGESSSPFFLGFDEVRFERFVIDETHEVSSGVFQIESTVQLDGSMRVGVTN